MANTASAYKVGQFYKGNTAEQFGLAELTANIAALNRTLVDALPGIVMQAAAIVEAEIAARAPVDTGALVRSLDAAADRRKTSASATVQIERSGRSGTEHYAIFNEFGTSRMRARPFFRPGIEAARPKVDALMTQEITALVLA